MLAWRSLVAYASPVRACADVLGLGISLTITTAQQYPTRFHAKLKETIIIGPQ